MKKNKQNYVAPGLTVVEFRVEKGYAVSGPLDKWSSSAQQIQMLVETEMGYMSESNDGEGNLVGGYMNGEAIDNSNPTGGSGWEFENGGWF